MPAAPGSVVFLPLGSRNVSAGRQEVITIEGKDYLLELPLIADVALIKAHRADRSGNLVFRKSARNFNPLMATACQYAIIAQKLVILTRNIKVHRPFLLC